MRSRLRGLGLALCMLGAASLTAAAPAGASQTRNLLETFGSAEQPSFGRAESLAVQQASGDVLAIDKSAKTLSRWHSDGTPSNFPALGTNVIDGKGAGDGTPENGFEFGIGREVGLAVDESGGTTNGDIYVAQGEAVAGSPRKVIDIFSETGEYLGQLSAAGLSPFGKVCGVAVDGSGDVYVGDEANGIHKFSPAANPPVNGDFDETFTAVEDPCTLAAGAGPTAGALFAVERVSPAELFKLDPGGGLLYPFPDSVYRMPAVNPATGHVIAGSGSEIKEFDAASSSQAVLVAEFAAVGNVIEGLAINGAAERLYASRSGNSHIEVFGPLVPVPDSTTEAASGVEETEATLNGTVNPEGVEVSDCHFEYGPTSSYGTSIPCAESPAEIGTAPHPVHAHPTSLAAGTVYHFRLVAENLNGKGQIGKDLSFKTLGPPVISADRTLAVSTSSAELRAAVNPEGLATEYSFQWGTSEAYGHSTPFTQIGKDRSEHALATVLEGLTPGQTYHWRIVARNVASEKAGHDSASEDHAFTTYLEPAAGEGCSNQALRGGPAAFLPDCRAYEMVSPVDKNGGDVDAYLYEGFDATPSFPGLDQSAPQGTALAYTGSTAFPGSPGSPFVSEYIARRGSDGWETEAVNPPEHGGIATQVGNIDSQYKAFSEDLSSGWAMPESGLAMPGTEAPEGPNSIYRRDNGTGGYEWTHSVSAEPEPCVGEVLKCYVFPELQGHSADGARTVFRVNDALTPEAPRGVPSTPGGLPFTASQLYEWTGSAVRLVSILPEGEALKYTSSAGTENDLGPVPYGSRGRLDTTERAVSEDGSRIYWTNPKGNPAGEGAGAVFLRTGAEKPHPAQALGTGDLTLLAKGKGTTSEGSTEVSALSTETGAFEVGEGIWGPAAGPVIAPGTTIVAVGATTLTLSKPAIGTGSGKALFSGSRTISNVATGEGAFQVGQRIYSGKDLPEGARITAVGPGSITLSQGATVNKDKAGVALKATLECSGPSYPCTNPVSDLIPGINVTRFLTASADGSKAIVSVDVGSSEGGLYEYAYDEGTGEGEVFEIAEEQLGVLGASSDLSSLYFASEEAIAETENEAGEAPQAGKPNLYLREVEGEDEAVSFIGVLAKEDISSGFFGTPSPVNTIPRDHIARVSPDGRHLAFVSASPALAEQAAHYDNRDVESGKPDREVYLYDAEAGELVCASCNPSGARPLGEDLEEGHNGKLWTAAWIPGYQAQLYGRRPMSSDGNRLFFNSVDPLALRDVNGAQDVYEWEAPGSGSCSESSPSFSSKNGGCVDLISTGQSPRDSEFVDASESGGDVFLRTESSLAPSDPGLVDIYDARSGGGFAAPAEAPACEGDACQSVPSPPQFKTPASPSFHGPGNLKQQAGCKQGRRAARLTRRAKRLRALARHSGARARAKRLHRARALAKHAHSLSRAAKRCRRTSGRAAR